MDSEKQQRKWEKEEIEEADIIYILLYTVERKAKFFFERIYKQRVEEREHVFEYDWEKQKKRNRVWISE